MKLQWILSVEVPVSPANQGVRPDPFLGTKLIKKHLITLIQKKSVKIC